MTTTAPAKTFRVEVWHNDTTVAQAAAIGDPDALALVGYRPESMMIWQRMGNDRLRAGDILTKVVTLELDATSATDAARAAWDAGNAPWDTEAVRAYRAAKVRSLCAGDVLVVHTPDGPAAYTPSAYGWSSVDLRDYTLVG